MLPSVARAADCTASNEAELRSAIAAANADGDPTSTITLTSNIAVSGPTAFPAVTKPGTIDRGDFGIAFSNNTLTNYGSFAGTATNGIETSNNYGHLDGFSGNGGTTIINSGTSAGILFRSGANTYELRAGGSLNPRRDFAIDLDRYLQVGRQRRRDL